jgi:hypothetical protein
MSLSNDAARFARDLGNVCGSPTDYSTDPGTASRSLTLRKVYKIHTVTSADTNNANTAESTLASLYMKRAGEVKKLYIVPDAAVTASATDFKQVIIARRDGIGGSAVDVVTANTTPTANGGTGNWAQYTVLTVNANTTAANSSQYTAGSILTWRAIFQGLGVQLPKATYHVEIEEQGL